MEINKPSVVVMCGSGADIDHARSIIDAAATFGLGGVIRIASAHRTPEHALAVVRAVDDIARSTPVVLITVAGRSNALSGFSDPQTAVPVIACPPPSTFADDIWSSVRMPAGVGPMYSAEPVNAALAAAKIIGMVDAPTRDAVRAFQETQRSKIHLADSEAQK